MCNKNNKNMLIMPCKCYLYCIDCSEKIKSKRVYIFLCYYF